jgi:TolB-like protein/Tfp pilus assembly protein PilF
MFTDITGYTALLGDDEEAARHVRERHRTTIESAVEAHGGELVNRMGDGTVTIFATASEAVAAAVEIQGALQMYPKIPVRIGIHLGEVAHDQEGAYGDAVNVASRINTIAPPGAVLVSEAIQSQLENQPRLSAVELGAVPLKNVRHPVRLFAIAGERLAIPTLAELTERAEHAGLERLERPAARLSDAPSIAVLPFVNLSADKNDEYLSDGMTEELINALAKVPGLRVPGRTSCFSFKGKSESDIFRKVGDQLHVNTVLEGSVRKAGERLRVTAQLINVSDGYHLWSKNYDGDMNDILSFQSNVAEQVVQALQGKLDVDATRVLEKRPTENPEAHRLYLLGRYEFARYTQVGWGNAIRNYEQALKIDPDYALAYCGLADTYAYMGSVVMPGKEALTKQKELAQKALELDPELAEAHLSLGIALCNDWHLTRSMAGTFDWQKSANELDRAIQLNPNLAWAYEGSGWLLNGLGRSDEAIAEDKKAIELDPLNPFFQVALSFFLYFAGRYDDTITQARRALELDPNSTLTHNLLGRCLLWKGDTAGAIAEFQKTKALEPGAWYQGFLGYAYAISGERAKAEEALRELEELANRQYVSPIAFVTIYLGLGERQKALDWLEKSYEDQESMCWLLKVDRIYDSVRKEPRFHAILKEIGLE